ncbi:hypothetical protein [Chryseobacterium chendengshani]|uniref:hypothetical protein n=1 Tax=Chryseobacterium sp. LJ756 TaxID=2864113 RepID=UPI001C64168E|nr:hypothetical protein [Chryseobacterium sp. LJ756]MBW7676548.1 hypothetical protein [Chryseobacterium sp. LJ756]
MKKIAYIEIDTHAEIAQDFMDLMHDSGEISVDYYFSEKIKNQLRENGESVYITDSSMILDQLSDRKYDLIIIGTVHRYFNIFFEIFQKYNAAVIIHNINFSKISKFSLIKNTFKADFIYRLKLWSKEGLFYTKETYAKAKNHLVLDHELCSEKYRLLPIFYTKSFNKTESEILIIVVPGGVSQKRRDYHRIFKTIRNLDIKNNIIFVFLGKAKGEELKNLKNLSRIIPGNITLQYFSERVSSDVFDGWMKKADVLWCPIQEEAEFFSQKEIYGKTKMTGNLGDAIKYGKPAVFPSNYSSELDFIIPEEENLIEQFQNLKNIVFDFQKNFSREKIQKDLENLLNELIST